MPIFPGKIENGVGQYKAISWQDLQTFLTERIEYRDVIWRGQRRFSWPLESTYDRLVKSTDSKVLATHLSSFKYACRGRRGINPADLGDDEWWSLGQHFGLATPLLDWTTSPYVALFFAMEKPHPSDTDNEDRVIYGLKLMHVNSRVLKMKKADPNSTEVLEFVRPLTDENPRLVSQGGIFTKCPIGVDVEAWVKNNFSGRAAAYMYKISVPNSERDVILKALNRMNINHLSLFPDLNGASLFCNMRAKIISY